MSRETVRPEERDSWACVSCQAPWFADEHQAAVNRDWKKPWRAHPGQLVPYRKWFTERIPGGRDGNVLCGDDGLLRIYGPNHRLDDAGLVWPLEVKTFGAPLDNATQRTFSAMGQPGRLMAPLVLVLVNGNVPGPLQHWPQIPWYDLPEPLVIAERIVLNGVHVSEAELIDRLTDPRTAQLRSVS